MSELGGRARKILYAAVTEFIATGEPVGSRTLSKKYGLELSPASIRNVLADLEESGYLLQPHASAGRVPSEKAFRLFIDALMQVREISVDQRASIGSRLAQLGPGEDPLREAARLLSTLTGTAAVVVAPKLDSQSLRQLRFVPTRPGELLAVIVTDTGQVENRFVRLDRLLGRDGDGDGGPAAAPAWLSADELARIHNLLDDVLEGRNLREIRELFARRLQDARSELGELRRRAFELGAQALRPDAKAVEVVIEGQAQLFDKPEFADVDRIKSLVRLLEERERLVAILDKTLETRGVRVVLPGEPASDELGEQLSLVSARYAAGSDVPAGTVGVLGPTRMDYASIVPLVSETALAVSAFLGKRDGGS